MKGLINGEVKELTTQDVSSVIQRGGTMLKTARSAEFQTVEGRKKHTILCSEKELMLW